MQKQKIKINIGCGRDKKPGFIGIDIDENVCPDIVASALDLPFDDGGVDEVVSEHLVEHFTLDEAQKFFDEIYRVLKKGGIANIKVDKDWSKRRLMKKDRTHKHRYKKKELEKMVQKYSCAEVKDKVYFLKLYKPRRKIFIHLKK